MSSKIIQQKTKIIQEKMYDFIIVGTFGDWLKKKREALRISGAELERKTKISRQYISNLERNVKTDKLGNPIRPSRDKVIALAKALEVDLDEALQVAGYAPNNFQSEVQALADKLAKGVMASGFDDLEDEQLKEDFLADMQTIAVSMLKRKLEEQEKRRRKNDKVS